jgi:hypothetical protein
MLIDIFRGMTRITTALDGPSPLLILGIILVLCLSTLWIARRFGSGYQLDLTEREVRHALQARDIAAENGARCTTLWPHVDVDRAELVRALRAEGFTVDARSRARSIGIAWDGGDPSAPFLDGGLK